MTDDDIDNDLWRGITRRELQALNAEDRTRALAALRRFLQSLASEGPVSLSGRAMTADEEARVERARRWRAERMSRPPYTVATPDQAELQEDRGV